MNLVFGGTTFTFSLLTTRNRYEPEDFQITQGEHGVQAVSHILSFGEKSGETGGYFEVTFREVQGKITWTARAEHAEKIRGIKVALTPLPLGSCLVPLEPEFTLQDGEAGRVFSYPGGYYPIRHISSTQVKPVSGPVPIWAAQFLILKAQDQNVFLSAREYPPRTKKVWIYRKGDVQEIHLYSEADAFRRANEYTANEWILEIVPNWRDAVAAYSAWMAAAFGIAPFEQRANLRPWMKEINLTVVLHGLTHDGKICHRFEEMAARLVELSSLHPARKTLVKLVGFEGNIDRRWPDSDPATELGGEEGFRQLVATAHQLGYHILPHLNVWGASFENPATQAFLKDQICDPEGRPSTWSYDYDQDEISEEIFAYISPDAPAWRENLHSRIAKLIALGVDAIYLDQTGTFINDLHHDHYRGLKTLFAEFETLFPDTQITCEAPTTEVNVRLCPVICGISLQPDQTGAELYNLLFGQYIRQYGYNLPPEPYRGVWGPPPILERWSKERFMQYHERSAWVHGIPSLNLVDRRIRLDSETVQRALACAREYQILNDPDLLKERL